MDLKRAYDTTDIQEFLSIVFPPEWKPIAARIIESGVQLQDFEHGEKFAPRWSNILKTVRESKRNDTTETYLKSIIYRVHDCIHQLWGLPVPKDSSYEEFTYFKRVWMCAEVSVLTITEFFYCQWLYDTFPELRRILENRNTLLFKQGTRLKRKTMLETACILDELLHKKKRPFWVRENPHGVIFVEDYVPMLEEDRLNIDFNWGLLKEQENKDYMKSLPNQRYGRELDGRELTSWMINDFTHLLETDEEIDWMLARFNQERRSKVNLPERWNIP